VRKLEGAESAGRAFAERGIDRWEAERRITPAHAMAARHVVGSEAGATLMRNVGAHLVLSLVLRFPLGSIGRFAWVVAQRRRARGQFRRGALMSGDYAAARSIHSWPVATLSVVPLLGAAAYLASPTVRRSGLSRILMDQFAYQLPFGIYRRLHLGRLTAPRALPVEAVAVEAAPTPESKCAEPVAAGC
jgi:hypothetical protein